MKLSIFILFFLVGVKAFAWGKQGHATVNQTAALLLADSEDRDFLRDHAYDLAYFANVPDVAWKQEKTYKTEDPQHFMDMEIFEREIKNKNRHDKSATVSKLDEAFMLDREEFDAKFPKIQQSAGRSWWRTREIYDLLHKQSEFLADNKMSIKDRHELQAQWLVLAGVLGHYVGDLSQPLHLTENYDGQKTSQKGIHSHFEDKMVNLLIPKLQNDVLIEAKKRWPEFTKKNRELSTLSLISALTEHSRGQIKNILGIDKKNKRKKYRQNVVAYEKVIIDQLTEGSLTLAELWRRNLDWKFNSQGFYTFISIPEYILPGTSRSTHIEEIKEKK